MNNPAHARESTQGAGPSVPAPFDPGTTLRASIKSVSLKTGQSFRNIPREIHLSDLRNPGVQKLLLETLANAEAKCKALESFVERYHEADKRAAVLEEKLKANAMIDISFTVEMAVGGLILGLVPTFWDGTAKGPIVLAAGLIFFVYSVIGRIVRHRT